MAKLTATQAKALTILTAAFNAPLLLQTPPGRTRTEDEYLDEFIFGPPLDAMVAQAAAATKAPIVEKLEKAISEGDVATVQAFYDAAGIAAAQVKA